MKFNISLQMELCPGLTDEEVQEYGEIFDKMILPLCDMLSICHERDIFDYYVDEIAEMRGNRAYGFSYHLHRTVRDIRNYCSFVKVFEGIREIYSRLDRPVRDCTMTFYE